MKLLEPLLLFLLLSTIFTMRSGPDALGDFLSSYCEVLK